MASSTLSLKSLRDSSTLKSEISKLESEKKDLLGKLEREQKLVKKLQDDLISQKKDFEHLEKQFDHFAGIEADYEALQQEVQMERLENLLSKDKVENQSSSAIKKAREEIKTLQQELKELKQLDPQRLKRQVIDLKKKNTSQAKENKTVSAALVSARKELKETSAEKEGLQKELEKTLNEQHAFWQSKDGQWALFETGLLLKDESLAETKNMNRIRCLNRSTGSSILSKGLIEEDKDKDKVSWFTDTDIPEEVSIEAGKRLKAIATKSEEDD
jgi:chromosome segregation ATPase